MTSRSEGSAWKFVARLAVALVLAGACVAAATRYVVRPWTVAGPSMEPTLRDGERVFCDLWTYRGRAPRAGEVVLLDASGPGGRLLKRIAAGPLPGPEFGSTVFVVLGDNPAESLDSRTFGPIGRDRIRGRVVFRYWPPSRAGAIE